MNITAPAYCFDLAPDRFDIAVANAFAASKAARFTRDHLIDQLREGRFDHLLLKRLAGLEGLSDEVNERAARNIIDFQFEPLVMQTMSLKQANAYFSAVENTLAFDAVASLGEEGPLWIDSVHHICVFSVIYRLALLLAQHHGYRRLVLLHQGQRPEPRLTIIANLIRQIAQIGPVFLRLQGRWFQELVRTATPDTAIFYFTDMPAAAFQRTQVGPRGRAHIGLYAAPGLSCGLDTLSGSGVFARRIKASHIVVDYPRPERLRLRHYNPADPTSLCPLENWVFWPLLGTKNAPG